MARRLYWVILGTIVALAALATLYELNSRQSAPTGPEPGPSGGQQAVVSMSAFEEVGITLPSSANNINAVSGSLQNFTSYYRFDLPRSELEQFQSTLSWDEPPHAGAVPATFADEFMRREFPWWLQQPPQQFTVGAASFNRDAGAPIKQAFVFDTSDQQTVVVYIVASDL